MPKKILSIIYYQYERLIVHCFKYINIQYLFLQVNIWKFTRKVLIIKMYKKIQRNIEDSDNDVDMIKNVDYGCAVKVAKEGLKKISDYICVNDYAQDAVKEVIDKILI